jgi:uncharacterized tellurite resistance protein B-like protein
MELSVELKGQFLRLYEVAITDGDFSLSELKMLYHFAEERGVPKSELDSILLSTTGTIIIPDDVETRIEYLFDLAKMIWADHTITEDELNTLKKYCRKFEFLDENIDELSEYLIQSVQEGKTKYDILKEISQ